MQGFGVSDLVQWVRMAITSPHEMALHWKTHHADRAIGWTLVILAAVLNAALILVMALMDPSYIEALAQFGFTPTSLGFISACLSIVSVFALHFVGGAMGGTARFVESLTLNGVVQILGVILAFVQVVLTIVSPLLGLIAMLVRLFVIVRLYAVFTQVAHDFDTVGRAVFAMIGAVVGVFLGFMVLLVILQIVVGTGGLS